MYYAPSLGLDGGPFRYGPPMPVSQLIGAPKVESASSNMISVHHAPSTEAVAEKSSNEAALKTNVT